MAWLSANVAGAETIYMVVDALLDTNVLVCAASSEPAEDTKRARAVDLINTVSFGLSAQVLQEFYVVATRKAQRKLSPVQALWWLERFMPFPCVDTDIALVHEAALGSERHQISYWDAAIIAAAERLGAPILYTEDLTHEQTYGLVRVINPFLPA
jgi:predicted nucleic acid-binding protein